MIKDKQDKLVIDQIEYRIARELADHHSYPFAQNIYSAIFKAFSHFPLKLAHLEIKGPGKTITYIALVVKACLENRNTSFIHLFEEVLAKLDKELSPLMVQEPKIETYLGCILYFYHPTQIKNAFTKINVKSMFNAKELYEYEIKKNTVLLHVV